MTPPRLSLADFQKAAAAGELFLAYQPKLNLRTNRIDGVEALARWQRPLEGMIEPSSFISAAERCGAIDWFTEWALDQALTQQAAWHALGHDMHLAVNISALNLKYDNFPDLVEKLCHKKGLSPLNLTLELTEGATQEAIQLMDTVARLRLKGMSVSLDDFGTGYGSMVQLRQLPFTELKIDRTFIADLLTSRDSRVITRTLISLAHDLGLCVTAEGIEDEDTLNALRVLRCDRAQGFFIGHPMSPERLSLLLERQKEEQVTCGNDARDDRLVG